MCFFIQYLIPIYPPYANIIPYSKERIEGDLSNTHSIAEFAKEMKEVAMECYRVLKPNHFCAILIGDTRRNLHYIPVAFRTLNSFLEVGLYTKRRHNKTSVAMQEHSVLDQEVHGK